MPNPFEAWRLPLTMEEQAMWLRFQVHDPETGFLVGFRPENSAEFSRLRAKIDAAARTLLEEDASAPKTPDFLNTTGSKVCFTTTLAEIQSGIYRCSHCGAANRFVNQCGCDPNNTPTKPRL